MNTSDFVKLAQRMVVEYYNRYIQHDKKKKIQTDNVEIFNLEVENDGEVTVILRTVGDSDSLLYTVVYNPNATKKDKQIISYIWN